MEIIQNFKVLFHTSRNFIINLLFLKNQKKNKSENNQLSFCHFIRLCFDCKLISFNFFSLSSNVLVFGNNTLIHLLHLTSSIFLILQRNLLHHFFQSNSREKIFLTFAFIYLKIKINVH